MKRTRGQGEKTISPKEVGARIRETRRARGLSQEALGERLEPKKFKKSISDYERGKTDLTLSLLYDIASALNVSISYLSHGLGRPDVVMSPLQVVLAERVPVTLVEYRPERIEVGTALADYPARPEDEAIIAIDSAMSPEIQPGDTTFVRPTDRPKPGSVIWVRRKSTREIILRRYRKVRDRTKPDTTMELIPVNRMFPVEGGGDEDFEVLGQVVAVGRKYEE